MLGMLPANQGLGADQVVSLNLRLIKEHKLVSLDRLAKVFLHRRTGIDCSLQGRSEEADRIAACLLGLIHGDFSPLQGIVRAVQLIPEDCNADAGRAVAFMAG